MTRSSQQDHATIMKIWNNVTHEAARNSERSAERGARNAQDFVQEQLEETLDENVALAQKNKQLQEQLDESVDLINFWADNCEAYRRTLDHLSKSWGQAPEGTNDPSIRTQVSQENRGLKSDEAWTEKKNRVNRGRTESQRTNKASRRKAP